MWGVEFYIVFTRLKEAHVPGSCKGYNGSAAVIECGVFLDKLSNW
jgi:hypothetical protein